jgi:hypothetical protein
MSALKEKLDKIRSPKLQNQREVCIVYTFEETRLIRAEKRALTAV